MALPDLAYEETEPRDNKSPARLEACLCGKAISTATSTDMGQVGWFGIVCSVYWVKISSLILKLSQVKCKHNIAGCFLKTNQKGGKTREQKQN